MLHIATVHWFHDLWVDIQLDYLQRNVSMPFRVYAFLNGASENHRDKYFYSNVEPIESHPIKLNLLAEIIGYHSISDDLIMFIDGDAFPIGDICGFAVDKLREYPLIAVQRLENEGDIQPHPCFCMTTVGFWNEIGGDWKEGFQWKNAAGYEFSDVGGNLLKVLQDGNINWYPMLRSNKVNSHPLLFGIYDNMVYHHGSGFRSPMSRLDRMECRRSGVSLDERAKMVAQISDNMFYKIREDRDFYLEFI